MKLMLSLLTLMPILTFGKSLKEFNSVITNQVHLEIKKDEDKFKTRSSRAPASVTPVHEQAIEEPKKIDKTVRQIGPNSW
jgi:hypothetical protein